MKAIDIPSKTVEGWALPEMPGDHEACTWRIQVVSVWYTYIYSTIASKGSADIDG